MEEDLISWARYLPETLPADGFESTTVERLSELLVIGEESIKTRAEMTLEWRLEIRLGECRSLSGEVKGLQS
jgi:hypothetical protein